MLPCKGCAYVSDIPGNCHIRCTFDWAQEAAALVALLDGSKVTPRTAQWFRFPLNYDPVWGPDECPSRSATRDETKVSKPSPFAELLSLLG